MDSRQLRYFAAIYEHGTLSRAAEHLRVAFERRARIDIDGGADFLGDTRQRDIFGVHHAVTQFKMVHKQILIYAPFALSLSKGRSFF